ncbi:MAG TPA: hypothetical protein VJV79_11985 [Polyangiaceae bacterium]|nr:hypothetical protein [Polyangiaceae bacterium]
MRRALCLGLPLALLLSACTYDNGDARRIANQNPGGQAGNGGGDPACGPATPVQTWIDVDRQIETKPGEGAGVFVEYATGGHWVVRTTCDSLKNNAPCAWDIIVTPEDNRSITNVQPEDLEATDSVGTYPEYPRSYQLIAETSGDLDGFTFDTEPQTAIQLDVFLDQACALPYVFWVGDGALHTGAPSNPIVLVPTPE